MLINQSKPYRLCQMCPIISFLQAYFRDYFAVPDSFGGKRGDIPVQTREPVRDKRILLAGGVGVAFVAFHK